MKAYLKKLDIPPLSDDLNKFFKSHIDFLVKNFFEFAHVSYGGFSENKHSLNYVDKQKHLSQFGEPGKVSFYTISTDTTYFQKLWDFVNHQEPWFKDCMQTMAYQTVGPGTHVPPHIDDSKARKYGIIYLLDTGGDDVITKWYKKKPEAEHLSVDEGKLITYDNLECVYEHKLDIHTWYLGDYSEIHSIENLTRMRTALGVVVKAEADISI